MAKKKVRVRSKRLDQVDESKLALAIWLITQDLVEDRTSPPSDTTNRDRSGKPGEATA
jgi:hypothetical protein